MHKVRSTWRYQYNTHIYYYKRVRHDILKAYIMIKYLILYQIYNKFSTASIPGTHFGEDIKIIVFTCTVCDTRAARKISKVCIYKCNNTSYNTYQFILFLLKFIFFMLSMFFRATGIYRNHTMKVWYWFAALDVRTCT